MKVRFNFKKLKNNPETPWFILDLAMVLLVTVNLMWIFFDSLFATNIVSGLIFDVSPDFYNFYTDKIHSDFEVYDLLFVYVYLCELCLRWSVAIYKKTYHRWFFYPFIHWYDVLGCIPIGSFRFLRILRVISIVYRLQKMGIVDIRENYFYQRFQKYLGIITEEISDRVVINVLNNIQNEVEQGNPVVHQIQNNILIPRQEELVNWIGARLGHAIDHAYIHNELQVRNYLKTLVHHSLDRNSSVKRLSAVPVVGQQIQTNIEELSVELVEDVLVTLLTDFADPEQQLAANIINELLHAPSDDESQKLWPIIHSAILDSLELIKTEVGQQQWKVNKVLE